MELLVNAVVVWATPCGFAFDADEFDVFVGIEGAVFGESDDLFGAVAEFLHWFDDVGDDVSGSFDEECRRGGCLCL